MRLVNTIRRIVLSWDFLLALVLVVALWLVLPEQLPVTLAKDIFGMSVSLLAIIFSVFFAALAVLVAAGDNDFIEFLTIDNLYYDILWAFKFTLILLFVALMLSVFLFAYTVYLDVLIGSQNSAPNLPKWYVILGSFFALYALFASMSTAMDAIKHAETRARYIEVTTLRQNDKD